MGLNPGIAEQFKQPDTVCHSRRSGDSDDQASLRWVHDRIPEILNAPEMVLREGTTLSLRSGTIGVLCNQNK
jgi:hypothetical protein